MRIKNNKIDIVHMWNIVMMIIAILNIILAVANIFINSKYIQVIIFTICGMHLLFAIVEFLSIKHNEKVIITLLYGRMGK